MIYLFISTHTKEDSMKNGLNLFLARNGCRFSIYGLSAIFLLLCSIQVSAVSIQTFDSAGTPTSVSDIIREDPDAFMSETKDALRAGNLELAGYYAKRLVKAPTVTPEARAIYSLYLFSKKDLQKAISELNATGEEAGQFGLYAKAMMLRIEKKHDEAVKICKKAISLDKTHPFPWNILGRVYYDMENYEQSLTSFEKAVQLSPDFLPAFSNMGAAAYALKDYRGAVRYFQKAISLDANAVQAYYGLGTVQETMGNDEAALEMYSKSLEIEPKFISALQKTAELQIKTGRYQEALGAGAEMKRKGLPGAYEILGSASLHLGDVSSAMDYLDQAAPGNLNALYLKGFCYMASGDYNASLTEMETVLSSNSRHYGAYIARAALKFFLGKPINAKTELSNLWDSPLGKPLSFLAGSIAAAEGDWSSTVKDWRAAEDMVSGFSIEGIDSRTLKANEINQDELRHLNLGVQFYLKNLTKNAISAFNDALSANNRSIMANHWLAMSYIQAGQPSKAVNHYENAIEQAPNFFSALYAAGEINFKKGEIDLAADYFNRALEQKKDAGILVRLGLIYEKTGDLESAEKHYKTLIRFSPDFFVGYNQLAWLYAKRGIKLDEAMIHARKANELQPGNASILDTMGWIYFQNQNYEKALEYTEKSSRIDPYNPTIYYHLGVIYHSRGDNSTALKHLRKALDISNSFDEAENAQQLIAQID